MTPEGRVKSKVKRILERYNKEFDDAVYAHWPVQNGMGEPTLDCNGCVRILPRVAVRFDIETKAPGKRPTPRQELTIERMRKAGSRVFVIDGDTTELETWLANILKPKRKA